MNPNLLLEPLLCRIVEEHQRELLETADLRQTLSARLMYASAESPTAMDCYRRDRGPLGCGERDPGAGSSRIDRDRQLLEALRLREPTAAERLVATYGDPAYRLAVRITGDAQDAEEAVQGGFWSVVRKIDTFGGDSAFGTWLYRIISNAAYDKIRRRPQAFVEISLDEVLPPFGEDGRHARVLTDWSSSINDPAVQTELRAVLSSAVSELPAHYRAVILLHDVEGLSMAAVANALRITVPTAKSRAHRARLWLRKRLSMFIASAGTSLERSARRGIQLGVKLLTRV
jgi:RNA polymerase sigma-70 factor, ECF subfamily